MTPSSTTSTTSTRSSRSRASSTWPPAAPMRRTAISPAGAAFATRTDASSSPSVSTCTLATPGSGPTPAIIREKFQIPAEQYVATGSTYEKEGYIPGWRCIRDKDGRIVVAICFNMHLGDAWEWANAGDYPEKFSGLAFRIVLNYITYTMTR